LKHRKNRAPLLVLAGLLLSCGGPSSPAPEVEYSGCWAAYLPGPVCALWPQPYRRINLWVKNPPPEQKVEIRAGGQLLNAPGQETKGEVGSFYKVSIPEKADLLTVSVLQPDGRHGESWSLRLAEPQKPGWLDEIEKLNSTEALARLADLRKTAPQKEQGLVLGTLAKLAHGSEKEESYLKQGLSADRALNLWSGEVEKATQLAGLYIDQGRFTEAQQTLAELKLFPQAPADSKFLVAYSKGLLGDAIGDYRMALEQLRRAVESAGRVAKDKYRWDAEQILARVLQDLGLLTNWGWSLLRARDAGEEAKDPTPLLKQAQAEFDKNECRPQQRLNSRLNLVFAYQQAERWQDARRELDQVASIKAEPDLIQRLWWDDLEARTAIAEGHPERALRFYEQLARKAETARSPESHLQASLGLARARIALGQRRAALEALADANGQIDRQSWYIPPHEGRDTYLAQREEASRLYLQLLLDQRDKQGALDFARRDRSRLLRQFAVRDRLTELGPKKQQEWSELLFTYQKLREDLDRQAAEEWQLAEDARQSSQVSRTRQLDETRKALDRMLTSLNLTPSGNEKESRLSPPKKGEVLLIYHPLPQGLWAGFAATERGIEVAPRFRLPKDLTDESKLSRLLLKPFRSSIEASERVRVLPYGPLRAVDFHALPFGGKSGAPLVAHHVVVYSLDVSAPATPAGRRAVVVANPLNRSYGFLPAAREEAKEVAAAVQAWGWEVTKLEGPKAGAEAVRKTISAAGLFHYAGHGIFAGFGGWDSELPLARESSLTLGQVLTLRPAPVRVVLSSCDVGRSSGEAPGEGIGLANAFLLAGSQEVIAATRPVNDHFARELMHELYLGWKPGADLARALQRAQLESRRKDPSSDAWKSFRLLVP
jgi:hypothetical protein